MVDSRFEEGSSVCQNINKYNKIKVNFDDLLCVIYFCISVIIIIA